MQNMIEEKPILSIETSETLCGACIYFSAQKYFESNIQLKNSHAEKLFEAIENVMNASGVLTKDLSAIAVSAGPGSFTGLRIGMSAAKGIAFGSSLPIIPVPTFEAMALQIANYLPENALFSIANKVNSDEIYFAKFQIISNSFIFVENLSIINHSEFAKKAEGSILFGNAVNIIDNLADNGSKISVPSPVYIADWARKYGANSEVFELDYLEPNYLKNFIIKGRKNG